MTILRVALHFKQIRRLPISLSLFRGRRGQSWIDLVIPLRQSFASIVGKSVTVKDSALRGGNSSSTPSLLPLSDSWEE